MTLTERENAIETLYNFVAELRDSAQRLLADDEEWDGELNCAARATVERKAAELGVVPTAGEWRDMAEEYATA